MCVEFRFDISGTTILRVYSRPPVDGWYFISTFLRGGLGDYVRFDMELNNEVVCTATADQDDANDTGTATCSSVFLAVQGTDLYYYRPQTKGGFCLGGSLSRGGLCPIVFVRRQPPKISEQIPMRTNMCFKYGIANSIHRSRKYPQVIEFFFI